MVFNHTVDENIFYGYNFRKLNTQEKNISCIILFKYADSAFW